MARFCFCLIAYLVFLSNEQSFASLAGADNASRPAYVATDGNGGNDSDPENNTNGWVSGDDGFATGAGAFNAWSIATTTTDGSSFAGVFIGDSTNLAGSNTGANINSSGVSFGMFANGGQPVQVDAIRSFSSALSIGQSMSIDLAVNFRSGYKGIDLRDGSNTTIFNFNVGSIGSGDDYTVQFTATGNGSIGNTYSSNTAFSLLFTQTSGSGGTWQIARSGGVTDFDSGTYSGLASSIKLYVGNTSGGDESNLYANNLSISAIPEASQVIAIALVGLLCGAVCWRRSFRTEMV